jgi:hypothetical protein
VQAPSDSIALDRNWLVALALPATRTTAVPTFHGYPTTPRTGSPPSVTSPKLLW